jgi:hypothetical protein
LLTHRALSPLLFCRSRNSIPHITAAALQAKSKVEREKTPRAQLQSEILRLKSQVADLQRYKDKHYKDHLLQKYKGSI